MPPSLSSGKLIKWKDDRGFGFIKPSDGSQEVFLHISDIKDATRRPSINDTIYYNLGVDQKGKFCAKNAFILGARKKSRPSQYQTESLHHSNLKTLLLQSLCLAILPLFGSISFILKTNNPLPIILYPAISIITYLLYSHDKSKAKQQGWRIPEKSLHLCELAGGWLGGFIAQKTLRHKSKKQSYQLVFWVIVALHHFAWLYWLYWLFIGSKG